MKPKKLRSTIANVSLDVPMYGSEAATNDAIERVNQRIREVEAASDRIDTQAFALLAAVSLAVELNDAEETLERDAKDLMMALSELSDKLRGLLDDVETS